LAAGAALFGIAYLASAVALYTATGGFTVDVLGVRLSLRGLDKPSQVAAACLVAAMLLSTRWTAYARAAVGRFQAAEASVHANVAWLLGLGAAAAISVLKVRQHWAFQTADYDLGIQANVAWNTAQGHLFYDSIQGFESYLGDHFSPIHLALAGLYRIWPDAVTLLVVQSVAIGLAAVAVYRLALARFDARWLAPVAVILFLLNPYLHRVSQFDFHPVAFAIPLFLWMLVFAEAERTRAIAVLAVIAASVEETLLPPLAGLGVYLAAARPSLRSFGATVAGLSILLLVLEVTVLMPAFLDGRRETHAIRYSGLGGASVEAIGATIVADPMRIPSARVPPIDKLASLGRLLLSVVFLPLMAPGELVLAAIPLATMLLATFEPQWQLVNHYSATTLPFLAFAAVAGAARLERALAVGRHPARPIVVRAASFGMLGLIGCTMVQLEQVPPYVREAPEARIEAVHGLIARIPSQASVCASRQFVPHLANRRDVWTFAHQGKSCIGNDPEYALFDAQTRDPWVAGSLGLDTYRAKIAEVVGSGRFRLVDEHDGVLLLERKSARLARIQ
jgi:uncharacterized membrane protein